jgi:hypothetical protein
MRHAWTERVPRFQNFKKLGKRWTLAAALDAL